MKYNKFRVEGKRRERGRERESIKLEAGKTFLMEQNALNILPANEKTRFFKNSNINIAYENNNKLFNKADTIHEINDTPYN